MRELARDRDLDARLAVAIGWTWTKTRDGGLLLCPPREQGEEDGFFYDESAGPLQLVPRWSTTWQDAIPLLELMTTCAKVQLSFTADHRWSFVSNGAGGYAQAFGGSGPEAIAAGVLQAAKQARWAPWNLSSRPMLYANEPG